MQKLLETSSNELVFYCILINSILISTPLYTDSDIMMASVTQQLMNKSAGDWNGAHSTQYKYKGNKNNTFQTHFELSWALLKVSKLYVISYDSLGA